MGYVINWALFGRVNPLPHMPVLGSFNSAANKDIMQKYGDTIICLSRKHWVDNFVGKKEKMLITSNFSFSHNVFRSNLLLMC